MSDDATQVRADEALASDVPMPACPQCHHQPSVDGQAFCSRCGLALHQPCPQCQAQLATPSGDFTACSHCRASFWACSQCGRAYHLDRTSCLNGYCPKKGEFWTAHFGSDTWEPRRGQRSVALQRADDVREGAASLLPGWLGGGGKERRFASLHHSGLLLSVQESGIVEMWAERGAPIVGEGDEFREQSVCLSRLDLGEPASGPPLMHAGQPVILGTSSLCLLEMTSNPSLGNRMVLPMKSSGPLRGVSLPGSLLVIAPEGLWEVDMASRTVLHHVERSIAVAVEPATDDQGQVLLAGGGAEQPFFLYRAGGEVQEIAFEGFAQQAARSAPEWIFHADHFVMIWRNQLVYLEEGVLAPRELPADVVARPIYDADSQRLTLLLSDGTIRSCSSTGDRFSFVCDMPGVPTTAPLRLGEHIYYGTDGRYLCRDEEAMMPRLNSTPWGELSYANGRIFGTTREGVLFAFCL